MHRVCGVRCVNNIIQLFHVAEKKAKTEKVSLIY